MKFLHAADLHLDSPLRGLASYDDAPVESIRGATREAFGNLVELAIEERVDFVLISGDLYDGDWQDFSTAIFLAKKIGELDRAGIRVLGVLGNHDAQSKLTKALERPKNLTLFPANKPKTEVLKDLGVAIHGQSFGQQHVDDNLAAGFPSAKKGMFNIGLLHTSLDGREGHAVYAPCNLNDLRHRDYDYWALGHVHAYEEVSTDPWVVFPGCVQGRHVRESGPKGCCLITVEENTVESVEHRALDVVRWANCEVDLSECNRMQEVLARASTILRDVIENADGRFVATRVHLVGASPSHSELQGRAQWLRQRLLETAAEEYGERLWIEKVVLTTTSELDRKSFLAGDGPLAEMAKRIIDVGENPTDIRGLDAVLLPLKEKLPSEVLLADDGLRLDDQDAVSRLIQEARELLIEKLIEPRSES